MTHKLNVLDHSPVSLHDVGSATVKSPFFLVARLGAVATIASTGESSSGPPPRHNLPTRVQGTGECHCEHTQCTRILQVWHQIVCSVGTYQPLLLMFSFVIIHLHVYFGTMSYAQLAPINRSGTLLPFQSSVGNLLRVQY